MPWYAALLLSTALRTTRSSPSIHSPGSCNCHTRQHAQHNGYLWPLATRSVWERVIHEGFGRGACARTIPALFIPLASNQRQCASGKVVLAAQTLHPCLGGKVLRSLCATTMRALTNLSYSMAEAAAAEVYPWRVLVVLVVVMVVNGGRGGLAGYHQSPSTDRSNLACGGRKTHCLRQARRIDGSRVPFEHFTISK
jgi:hypothetical protein